MSSVSPDQKAIVEELLRRRDTLPPDKQAIVDELGKRLGMTPPIPEVVAAPPVTPAIPPPTPTMGMPSGEEPPDIKAFRQQLIGANPQELLERMKGVAQSAGQTGMTAIQWIQHLLGRQPTPTPNILTAANPEQAIGQNVGTLLQTAALPGGAAGSMAGLPAWAARLPALAAKTAISGIGGGLIAAGQNESPTAGALVAGAMPGISTALSDIPSLARASANFQKVMAGAKDQPIDLTEAQKAVERAQELRQRGSSAPKVISDFIRNRTNAVDILGNKTPMTYEVGRDFASKASELSAAEKMTTAPQMKRQVTIFANAMRTANREAAERVGLGDLYESAMKEYRQAMNLREATDVIKKYAAKAAVAGITFEAARQLINSGVLGRIIHSID